MCFIRYYCLSYFLKCKMDVYLGIYSCTSKVTKHVKPGLYYASFYVSIVILGICLGFLIYVCFANVFLWDILLFKISKFIKILLF